MAVTRPCRTRGCLSAAASVCHRHLHHALPDAGARNDEYGSESDRAGHTQDARGADDGHAAVPGTRRTGLEKEAMLRNPETAYLVSDEEFDRQLDELGWSTDAMATRMGMYVEVGMYSLEKRIRDGIPQPA